MVYGGFGSVYGTGAGTYGFLTSVPGAPTQVSAFGLGVAGALVDLSSYITGTEGVTYQWGRQSEFRDPTPGQITFVLDNYDGRFTPGNTLSPYPTPLTEGTAVSWMSGTRLIVGYVTAIGFANSEADWGRITVTAMDAFGFANRTQVTDLANMIGSTGAYYWWPFTDTAGSQRAAGTGPSLAPLYSTGYAPPPTFGVTATAPSTDTQATFTYPVGVWYFGTALSTQIIYPTGSYGSWGYWVTPRTGNYYAELDVSLFGYGPQHRLTAWQQGTGTWVQIAPAFGSTVTVKVNWVAGVAHHVAFAMTNVGTTVTTTLYIDGVIAGTASTTVSAVTNAKVQPTFVRVAYGDGSLAGAFSLSHLYHAPSLQNEAAAGATTETARMQALTAIIPQLGTLTVGTVSSAPVGPAGNVSNVWSAICDVLRTEQGHIYLSTTGGLLSPATTTVLRGRDRPAAVTLTLDAKLDLYGIPQIERDATNMFGTITATGPTQNASITDQSVIARVGNASTSEQVVLRDYTDLYGWASDRMVRGKNLALKVSKVDIDSLTSSVTAAQIQALLPGDRIRITNLHAATLGFSTWDGWLIGVSETHSAFQHMYTLYLAPAITGPGVYDTDLFGAGGQLSLSASITSGSTTMSVASADGVTKLATTGTPYTLIVDSEQVTVTACTGGTPQVATITRAVNGTTAAAHSSGALVDDATVPLFEF